MARLQRGTLEFATRDSHRNMIARCKNDSYREHHRYKDRGIKVCDRWLGKKIGYKNFVADMGLKPSLHHSLDRIDNDGDYTPENCRWTTGRVQNNNRSNNVILEYCGKKYTRMEASRVFGINYSVLMARQKLGWSVEKALTTTVRSHNKKPKKVEICAPVPQNTGGIHYHFHLNGQEFQLRGAA